jgi:hypothetical protein
MITFRLVQGLPLSSKSLTNVVPYSRADQKHGTPPYTSFGWPVTETSRQLLDCTK